MANNFILRILRSFTSGRIPRPKSLPEGMLAVNAEDGRIWLGNQSDDPQLVASRQATEVFFNRTRNSIVSELVVGTSVQQAIEEIAVEAGVKRGISVVDDISGEFNSARTSFGLSINGTTYEPPAAYSIMVHLDGAYQYPGKSYIVTGSQINFYEPPTTGQQAYIVAMNDPSILVGESSGSLAPGSINPTLLDRSYVDKSGDTLTGRLGLPASIEQDPVLHIAEEPGNG